MMLRGRDHIMLLHPDLQAMGDMQACRQKCFIFAVSVTSLSQVEPGASLDYAWDEPQATRRLRCLLEGQGMSFRDPAVHQYSLDEIRVRCCYTSNQNANSWVAV